MEKIRANKGVTIEDIHKLRQQKLDILEELEKEFNSDICRARRERNLERISTKPWLKSRGFDFLGVCIKISCKKVGISEINLYFCKRTI